LGNWRIGALAFLDADAPDRMVFLLVAMLGVASGGLPALSSYFPAYACFACPLLLLVALKLASLEQSHATILSVLTIVYLGVSLMFGRNLSITIGTSITSDLENEHLLAQVTVEKSAAERANAEKSQFLAAASHDVRQPLHAAGFFLESLGKRLDNKPQRELYHKLHDSFDALESMFAVLLDISRLDAGAVTADINDIALDPILRSVVAEFTHHATSKDLLLELVSSQAVVRSDAILLPSNLSLSDCCVVQRGRLLKGSGEQGEAQFGSAFG
jgi:signal transduction histidine kinase